MTSEVQEPVAIPQVHYGDTIHVGPHEIFRHSKDPVPVPCKEADVQVDSVLEVKDVIVIICWHIPVCDGDRQRPAVCGATAYDADDSVPVIASAA